MPKEMLKVLMPLHGIWPIPVPEKISPIELQEGISLVNIDNENCSLGENDDEFTIPIHEKDEIQGSMGLSDNHPFSRLPKMGLLFELVERKEDGNPFFPNYYAEASMKPITTLRLFQTGEFVPTFIIWEHGYYSYQSVDRYPHLLHYEITSETIEPLKQFYDYQIEKWKQADTLIDPVRGMTVFDNLYWRLNNAVDLLNKSYFDVTSFKETRTARPEDSFRPENFLRFNLCWMGIESLCCHGDSEKIAQLKKHIPLFLSGYTENDVAEFIDEYYSLRSAYTHADPSKMRAVKDRELNVVRDALKLLILTYFSIVSDSNIYKDLKTHKNSDSIKALTKLDLSAYFPEVKEKSGADFESYSF